MNFGEGLAGVYDLLYQDKDYGVECDFVEEIFRRFAAEPVKTVLEGGSGTGGHAIPLAERGYQVTGFDRSEMMVNHARAKMAGRRLPLDFQVADLLNFNLGQKFDACLCMFAVMGYLTGTDDFITALRNIRNHLKPGGIFAFDIWNGLAVLTLRPSERTKVVEDGNRKVIRTARPEMDTYNHLCHVYYHMTLSEGGAIVGEMDETHTVRYFFPQEIIHYLKDAGFEPLTICPFLELSEKADENVWNIAVVARAV